MDTENKQPKRSTLVTRLGAFCALAGFVGGVGYAGSQAYRAATDSFVAPIILTPDNDLVIANRLKMSDLAVERLKASAQLAALAQEVEARNKALTRLRGLHETAYNATEWLRSLNLSQASAGAAEGRVLLSQHGVLSTMTEQQEQFVSTAKADMEAGLVSKADYARELQALNQMRVALLDNERSRLSAGVTMHQVGLAQKSLASRGGALPMPELVVREDEVVRIELEILKLEVEQRANAVEKRILEEKLAMIDEVELHLKGRPLVRAIERSMDVAFVPYTQLDGVTAGASIYNCTWGLFNCRAVGQVAEVVAGEVVLPDPWGNQARGQLVVLALRERGAARAKSLRVRDGGGVPAPTPPPSDAISKR
ncbi:hypothetical protein BH11MYX4_BH11MYX4_12820 [soil metagenome]